MTRFPPYQLDTLNHCLWKETAPGKSEPVGLAPKTFDVLRHLVENAGRLVGHDELLDALWRAGEVQPEVLKGHILAIRAALGDDAQHPEFIETHRGRGYRFIAAIDNGAPAAGGRVGRHASFVGRGPELESLRRAFAAAQSRKPGMIFVSGEPGMGKTTLIERFVGEVANGAHVRVAVGRSVESHGTGEPYFPFFEALASLIKSDPKDDTVGTLLATAPSWALQLPGLVPADRWIALQRQIGGTPRNRLVGELCDFIEALTANRTLLLVLEDLHWADFSTIDLLKSMAGRRHAAKLLVIGTYRKEVASYRRHPVGELVQNLMPYAICSELALPPLTEGEVGALIAASRSAEQAAFAAFMARQAGGNPLFVALILEQLVQRGAVAKSDAGWTLRVPFDGMTSEAPVTLANVVELQIRQLGPDQQAVLECASVFGDGFHAAGVAALAELDESAVERELEALGRSSMFIGRGAIEYPEEGLPFRRYLFRHAVYQGAFYERQAPTQRARRHLVAARVLQGAAEDPVGAASELARHFEAAAAWPQALAQLHALLVVAKRRFARRDAMTVVERAEAILQRYRGERRVALELPWMEEKAEIQAANHDVAARDTYAALVEAAAARGLVEHRVRALLGLAVSRSWLDAPGCLATLEEALRVGRMQDDPTQRIRTVISCHVWKIWVGGWDPDAAGECEALVPALQGAQDQAGAAWSMVEYSMLCLLSTRYAEAQETIMRNFAVLQKIASGLPDHGSVRATWMASLGMPWSDMLQGKLGMALERLDANIVMLERNAAPSAANTLRLLRAQLYVHALDFHGAREECDFVMRSIEERLDGEGPGSGATLPGERRICAIMLGLARIGTGNLVSGIEQLLTVEREILAQPISFDWYRLLFLEWGLARAHVRQGDLANATLRSRRLLGQALRTGERCWQALAWEMAAHVAVLGDDRDAAVESVTQALEIVGTTDVPLAAWRVYQMAASVHARGGAADLADRYTARADDARRALVASLPPAHRLRDTLGSEQAGPHPA